MHNSKMQTVSDSPLCRFCSKIDIRRLLVEAKAQGPPASGSPDQVFAYDSIHAAVPKFFAHHPNLVSLRDSARDCDLCSSIWDQYTQNAHPFEYTEDALNQGLSAESIWIGAEQWVEELQGVPTIAAVQYGPRGTARRLAWFEAFAQRGLSPDTAISTIRVDTVYADDTPSEASELLGRSIHASSLSDSCLALARDWVETCSGDHSECKQYSQKSPLLPRRVVEMFRNTPDQSLIAKVVDADGQQDKYVALSYCWGGPGVIMLTRDTQQLLQDGVPVKDFPATLQDAMTATWSLGICYIWIDCLCIQQDDKLDWGRQAVQMQSVYRNAAVTIRAACASTVKETLSPARKQPKKHVALAWHNSENKTESLVYLRSGSELSNMTTQTSVISKRGWTLEEDLLATRTLTFGSQQIWFDCAQGRIDEAGRRTRATEDYNSKAHLQSMYNETPFFKWSAPICRKIGIPPVLRIYYPNWRWLQNGSNPGMNDLLFLTHNSYFFQGAFPTPGGVTLTYFDLWRAIVKQYTSRTLTQAKDVLTALAGIAEAFHQTHSDAYIAGMWRSDLIRSMNWARSAAHRRSKDGTFIDLPLPSPKYLAPSWSWASVTGKRVSFMGSEPSSEETTFAAVAKVLDVEVELKGPSVFGPLSDGYLSLRAPTIIVNNPQDEVRDDPLQVVRVAIRSLLDREPDTAHEFSQQHRSHAGQDFALLHLCDYKGKDGIYVGTGTLLLETTGNNTKVWRRVGCFQWRADDFRGSGVSPYAELRKTKWKWQTFKVM